MKIIENLRYGRHLNPLTLSPSKGERSLSYPKGHWILLVLLFCFQFLIPGIARAYGRRLVGTSSGKFLQLPVNARAIALGEAYSTLTDGADSLYWNPAGLGRIEKQSISLMHAVYLQDVFYDYAAYARKMGKAGTFGVGVQYLSAGSIEETNEQETKVGSFTPQDMAISVSWGRKFHGGDLGDLEESEFIFGITGKFIQSKIIETANSGAIDVGIIWNPIAKHGFSIGAQNMGPALKFGKDSTDLPFNIRLGYANQYFEPLLLALDVNFPQDNDANVGIGMEYTKRIFSDLYLAGRGGYNSRVTADIARLSSLSTGVGLGWKTYSLDFAWVPFGQLGHSFRLSLSIKF